MRQHGPGRHVFGHRGVLRRDRHECGKLAGAGFVTGVWEGCLVGRHFLRVERALGAQGHDLADRQVGRTLAEGQPLHEALAHGLAHRQPGVGDDHAGEALGIGCHQSQAQEAAPVLAEQRHVLQVHRREPTAQPRYVALVAVVGALGRLVGTAKADQIRGDDTVA